MGMVVDGGWGGEKFFFGHFLLGTYHGVWAAAKEHWLLAAVIAGVLQAPHCPAVIFEQMSLTT